MILRSRWGVLLLLLGVLQVATGWLTPHAARGDTATVGAPEPRGASTAGRMGDRFLPDPQGIARFQGVLGYGLLLAMAYAASKKRREINLRPVVFGLALQLLFASIVLNPVVGQFFFQVVDVGVRKLIGFAEAGIGFVFQSTVPHKVTFVNDKGEMVTQVFIGAISPVLKNLATWVLPTVIFFSSMITLLYHLGIMQVVVKGIARAMIYTMRTSGSETLSCTANIFVGQTEAPLLVKPFVARMTESELMAVMVGGFATVAGGVLAIYVSMLQDIPGIAGHLVTASIMAAPCALAVSKLMLPETAQSDTAGTLRLDVERPDQNFIEAAARGATEGMGLLLNITAVLIAFVGLVALVNAILGTAGDLLAAAGMSGLVGLSLERILGWVLRPVAWSMGVPWSQAELVGQMMGEKLVLTEIIAYLHLKSVLASSTVVLCKRSAVIASYSLCGFANVASIGIQIGGIGGMAPSRRGDLARLGLYAMAAGAIVSCLSGAIAGMFV